VVAGEHFPSFALSTFLVEPWLASHGANVWDLRIAVIVDGLLCGYFAGVWAFVRWIHLEGQEL